MNHLIPDDRQERKEYFFTLNIDTLEKSDHDYDLSRNEHLALFREAGKPKVNFHLHSGTWKVVGDAFNMNDMPARGEKRGAFAFLKWYADQSI